MSAASGWCDWLVSVDFVVHSGAEGMLCEEVEPLGSRDDLVDMTLEL